MQGGLLLLKSLQRVNPIILTSLLVFTTSSWKPFFDCLLAGQGFL